MTLLWYYLAPVGRAILLATTLIWGGVGACVSWMMFLINFFCSSFCFMTEQFQFLTILCFMMDLTPFARLVGLVWFLELSSCAYFLGGQHLPGLVLLWQLGGLDRGSVTLGFRSTFWRRF